MNVTQNELKKIKTISPADNYAQKSFINGLSKYYKNNLIILTPTFNDYVNFKHSDEKKV